VVGRPPATTQEHAIDWLRAAIVRGELKPGHRIPQEDVAERIGVSIVPLREALRVLEGEGQVTYVPRRGYFVTELRIEDLAEIYDLRQALEERAARRALPRFDADAIARMEQAARACSEAAAAGRVAAELAANRQFHFALFEPAEAPHLQRLIRTLWDSTEAYRALYYNLPGERKQADEAHDRILRAVRAGDAGQLVSELDEHRTRALTTLREILPPQE
jgi:DNA-binding GntR family transcriptional regulator